MHLHRLHKIHCICFKFYSTKEATKNLVKYTNTINLPRTKFPSRLTVTKRKEIEQKILQDCHLKLYSYQRKHNICPEFVLHDGPPYANGDLHMGHAVNKILKDITLRYHVVNGFKVHYKAGWDCHGLPIELKAMDGKINVDPLQIRNKCREFALNTILKQKNEFKSWGIMADWNNDENIYKTYDPKFIENELRIFSKLYKKNLIYRDLKPVYWSPSSRTALAEAELEYNPNFISPSILLRLELSTNTSKFISQLDNNLNYRMYALIWTTTPWTLPTNQAICYNSKLQYCWIKLKDNDTNLYLVASSLLEELENFLQHNVIKVTEFSVDEFCNLMYLHPFKKQQELPFLPSDHVQDNKGTGLVHTSPAHGQEDFLVSLANKISIKCYVDEEGKYTNSAPDFLKGKYVLDEGNTLVMNYLKNDIIYQGKITHSYPIDWRTKKPVILRASYQWFIDTDKLKTKAIEEISKIEVYPRAQSEANKNMLKTQLEKRPYWCISRQRSWGVPIPVFYDKLTGDIITNEEITEHICSLLQKEQNMDFWWTKDVNELIPKSVLQKDNLNIRNIEKGKDIFDIWFDSGITWFNALDNEKIANLYLEGFDQFTGWFQSSLLTSIAYRNCAPYKSIFVHGFTVDDKGRKMSKSLGNVILPQDITKLHGTDVLRWWVASHGTQHSSIIVGENLINSSIEFLTKLRSILRFLNGFVHQKNNDLNENYELHHNQLKYLDKYFLHQLWEFNNKIEDFYKSYEYNRVTLCAQNFLANQISSIYFHLIKDRLYCGTNDEHQLLQTILVNAYELLCKSLWPIVPFIVEESWSYYAQYPFYETKLKPLNSNWKDSEADDLINLALTLRHKLNKKLTDTNTWTLNLRIECNEDNIKLLNKLHPKIEEPIESSELCEILQVSSISLVPSKIDDIELIVTGTIEKLCPRCRRFSVKNQNICKRCEEILLKVVCK